MESINTDSGAILSTYLRRFVGLDLQLGYVQLRGTIW